MADGNIIAQTNQKIFGGITSGLKGGNFLRIIGWLLFAAIVIGGTILILIKWRDKKLFSKFITDFDRVGDYYQKTGNDKAKIVKLGSGGFEILYLKKAKTWRIAYGSRIGVNNYYFFKSPDGYFYNGMFYGKIQALAEHGGLIPIVTANPLMRGQYTSLEKQIDALHSDKKSFMDKYGTWVLAISFVVIAGFMLSLCYKQFASAMASLGGYLQSQAEILDKLNKLAGNIQAAQPSGLVPAGLFAFLFRRKKKVNPNDVPPEILAEFNEAERRLKESGDNPEPYKILFELMMEHNGYRIERRSEEDDRQETRGNNIRRANSKFNTSKSIPQRSPRDDTGRNIPTPINTGNQQEYRSDVRSDGNSKARFKFRRRESGGVSDY